MLGSLIAAALAIAPEAVAQAPPSPPAATAPDEPGQARKGRSQSDLICKTVTPVGTRFGKRVCASRADWEERSRRDQDFIRTNRTAPTPNN